MKFAIRAVGVLVLVLSLAGPANQAAATSGATSAGTGFSEVAGCISGGRNLLVSVVVDESLSLRKTDPSSLRVRGITTAIDSLQQLTATAPASTNVEVNISTFARSFETLLDWRKVTPASARVMRSVAARALPRRDAGNATDYRQALLGAKRQLDARQQQLRDPNACKLLLWFTDGALDVDQDTAIAAREICQVGGIADAVRSDGIAVVALALFRPGAGVTSDQREQLRAVAEGQGAGVACGTVPIPSDSASGVYLPASDPAALQRLFAGAGALVAGGTEIANASCPGPRCPHGTYRLAIDRGIAGARVLVQAPSVPHVTVTSPSGRRLQLASGETRSADGASVSYLVRDLLATVNVSYKPYAKTRGLWLITPGASSQLSVYWFWGAQLSLGSTQLRAGARNNLDVLLEDQTGARLPASLYRRATAVLRVGHRSIPVRITPDGALRGRLPLGVRQLPSSMPVNASVTMRSVPGDVLLGPVTLAQRLPIELPPAYPSVTPKTVDFGQLTGLGTAHARLALHGSRLGPTQVCLTGSTVTVPGAQPSSALIAPGNRCVVLDANQTRSLPLRLTPVKSADGVASGELHLDMKPSDGSPRLQVRVPIRADLARAVDQETRWELIALLVAAALLLPILLLIASNLWLARFSMTSTSRIVAKPVKVTGQGLAALDGTELLEPEEFQNVAFSGVRRGSRMSVDGTALTLKARRVWSLKEPQAVAAGPAHDLLVSNVMPYRGGRVDEAPAAFGEVDASFVVIHRAGSTRDEAQGTLVMVVPTSVDRRGIKDRAERLSSLPDYRKCLDELSRAAASNGTASMASSAGTTAETGDQSLDERPVLPWESDRSRGVVPDAGAKRGRTRPRRDRRAPQSPHRGTPTPNPDEGQPTSATDDELPPLPDFLK